MMQKKKSARISGAASVIVALAVVAVVAVWFVSGTIKVDCGDDSVRIAASYWADFEIAYSDINAVTYRNDLDVGARKAGIGTLKLSVGRFQNDEFGTYNLYAYADSTTFLVLTTDGKTVVIGMRNAEDVQTIYNTIKERMGD